MCIHAGGAGLSDVCQQHRGGHGITLADNTVNKEKGEKRGRDMGGGLTE